MHAPGELDQFAAAEAADGAVGGEVQPGQGAGGGVGAQAGRLHRLGDHVLQRAVGLQELAVGQLGEQPFGVGAEWGVGRVVPAAFAADRGSIHFHSFLRAKS